MIGTAIMNTRSYAADKSTNKGQSKVKTPAKIAQTTVAK